MRKGYFITVEGIEGAGKSTQIKFIQRLLESAGERVMVTREPGGTTLGEQIRTLLLTPRPGGMCAEAELLLVFAARIEHVKRIIAPALAAGKWVLCDRFSGASYAYQGGGRGLPLSRIAALEKWALGHLRPDFTLLLDVPVEVGLQRAEARRQWPDRFEQERADFFERVRMSYLALAKERSEEYRLIDASQTLPQVQEAIAQAIMGFVETRPHG